MKKKLSCACAYDSKGLIFFKSIWLKFSAKEKVERNCAFSNSKVIINSPEVTTFLFQMMTSLDCGHLFCNSCWCEYLTTKIMDDGASEMIGCPSFKCQILVDDRTVMKLIEEPRTKLRYQHLITNSFVQVRSLSTQAFFRPCFGVLKCCNNNLIKCFSTNSPQKVFTGCIFGQKFVKKQAVFLVNLIGHKLHKNISQKNHETGSQQDSNDT